MELATVEIVVGGLAKTDHSANVRRMVNAKEKTSQSKTT